MSKIYQHTGQCHCGNIHFIFETKNDVPALNLRQCDCHFCQKHASRYTSDPNGTLIVTISNKRTINRYNFGHKTANFIICQTCGVMPLVTSNIEENIYAVLNVNCLDKVNELGDCKHIAYYDTEVKNDRLSRRKKNWISKVIITE